MEAFWLAWRPPGAIALFWALGVAVFAAHFALALWLGVRFWRQARRYAALPRDLAAVSDAQARRLPLAAWAKARFVAAPGAFDRRDALHALEDSLRHDFWLLLLHRVASAAPALSILITGAGLMRLLRSDAPAGFDPHLLLGNLPYLFIGLVVASGLCLFNHGYLQLVERQLEAARRAGEEWFDAAVWARLPHAPPEARHAEAAAEALAQAAEAVKSGAEKFAAEAAKLETAGAKLPPALDGLATRCGDITTGMTRLEDQFRAAGEKSASLGKGLDALSANLQRVNLAPLETAIGKFQTAGTTMVAAAGAFSHKVAAGAGELTTQVAAIGGAAAIVGAAAAKLHQSVERQAAATDALTDLQKHKLAPALVTFADAAGALPAATVQVTQTMREMTAAAAGVHRQLQDTAAAQAKFAAAADQFGALVKNDLAAAVTNLKDQVSTLTARAEDQARLAEETWNTQRALQQSVGEHYAFAQNLRDAAPAMRQAFEQITTSGQSLAASVQTAAPALHQLQQASSRYEAGAQKIHAAVEGLGPLFDRLGSLPALLEGMRQIAAQTEQAARALRQAQLAQLQSQHESAEAQRQQNEVLQRMSRVLAELAATQAAASARAAPPEPVVARAAPPEMAPPEMANGHVPGRQSRSIWKLWFG